MNIARTFARLALVPAVGAAVLLGAGSASAHVSVTASETAAGASTVLTFSVPHGCDVSPTTKIEIAMPEEIIAATATRQPFYDVETVMAKLDAPITDAHGNAITERVEQIVYTAKTPLPDGERDTFQVSVTLPDSAGETITFPTIQTCETGKTAWTEVAAEGQDSHDLEAPAPSVLITEAEASHDHGTEDGAEMSDSSTDSSAADDDSASDSDGSSNGLAIGGLVAGLLGLVAGGAALLRTRTKA